MNTTKKILEIHHTSPLVDTEHFNKDLQITRYFWYLKYSFSVKAKLV